MADEANFAPDRAQARAAAKKRRRKRIERREAYFELLASGYSYPQIAEAMKVPINVAVNSCCSCPTPTIVATVSRTGRRM